MVKDGKMRIFGKRSAHSPVMNDLPALTLDDAGIILGCSDAGESLLGYRSEELKCAHISALIPQLEEIPLMKGNEINPRLSFLCRCGHPFRTLDRNGNLFPCELHLFELGNASRRILRIILSPRSPS